MTEISRRNLFRSLAATAVVGTAGYARPLAASPERATDDMDSFLSLSAQLTGIAAGNLAPGVDPVGIKFLIFERAKKANPVAFESMLKIFDAHQDDSGNIILNLSGEDVRFLARSIMLAWYLGAWYDPNELKKHSYQADSTPYYYTSRRYLRETLIPFEIISPAAYAEGWVWRVAQTHPMGYSNLQFGYWSDQPPSLDTFIKPLSDPQDNAKGSS